MRAEWIASVSWIPLIVFTTSTTVPGGTGPGDPDPGPAAVEAVGSGLAAGFDHTCRLLEGGAVRCWGGNDQGQLGDGTDTARIGPVAVRVEGVSFAALSAGHKRTCAIAGDGRLFCWGVDTKRIPGQPMGPSRHAPVVEIEGRTFASVSVGTQHACALTEAGEAFCWGRNHAGELGNGTTESSGQPVPVSGGHTFTEVVVGGDHSCGLTGEGAVFCWGSNDFGELGVPDRQGSSPEPVRVQTDVGFDDIEAGLNRTCALTADGAAWCWGSNGHGALGDGTDEPRKAPTAVSGELRFTALALGNMHTCGLTEAGAAHCWGFNGFGELGDGTTDARSVPTAVSGEHVFTDIAAGGYHTCGITEGMAGPLCWGRDPSAGLAGAEAVRILVPTPIGGASVAGPAGPGGQRGDGGDR